MKKMNLRLRANDLVLTTLVCLVTTLIVSSAVAADEEQDPVEDFRATNDIVELHYPIDVFASYKQRRETHGLMFDIGYENVMLKKYVSIVDFKALYTDMFGESEFPVINLGLSYKYNFVLGSLLATVGYGMGSISEDVSGAKRTLTLKKLSGSFSYIMDNIFEEPYVAPYGTIGMMNLGIDESADDLSFSHAIDAMFYQAGFLFQLDWLDPSYSKKNIHEYSLQNTYLDLFVSKYEPSADETDPNTSTEYSLGAGIRMEF